MINVEPGKKTLALCCSSGSVGVRLTVGGGGEDIPELMGMSFPVNTGDS